MNVSQLNRTIHRSLIIRYTQENIHDLHPIIKGGPGFYCMSEKELFLFSVLMSFLSCFPVLSLFCLTTRENRNFSVSEVLSIQHSSI